MLIGEKLPKNKMLVVDDQEGVAAFLYDFFTDKGYDVIQTGSGTEAVSLVGKESPAVVLLDLRLGWGKNGIDVLKEIKKLSPETIVIMMTAFADEDVALQVRQLGADDYILKPFSLAYLERVVMLKLLNHMIKDLGKGRNGNQSSQDI